MKSIFKIGCMLMAIILVSCNHSESNEHHESSTFAVTSPVKKDITIQKEYVCQIRSVRNIELRALERGYLQSIFVDEGQYVTKGQRMFQVTPSVYQAEYEKAKAEAKVAEIEYINTKLLADNNVVSENELAMKKSEFDKAKAEVNLAKAHLDFTNIKAPFDGIIDHLHAREGSLLEEGELLTTLSDNSKMWVYFNVPEVEYLEYISDINKKEKQPVLLEMANRKLFPQEGYVSTIEGEFDNKTGNIAFRATFPNPNKILRHKQTGTILMNTPLKDVLIIPQKATFQILDKVYVFVVDESNTLRQTEVKIKDEIEHIFLVESGLSENDKILLEGIRKVKNGEQINFDFKNPESVISSLDLYAE